RRCRIENDKAAIALRGRHVPVVTQAELQDEIRPPPEIVLSEKAQRPFRDTARLIAEGHAERIRCTGEKCRDAGKGEGAARRPKVVIEKLPVLAADLERVPPVHAAQHISRDEGRVAASGWKVGGTAEVQRAAGNIDLWQADRLRNPVSNAEVGGIEWGIRRIGAELPIESGSHFVNQLRAESVCLTHGEELPVNTVSVSEAGNRIAGVIRLDTFGKIEAVIPMQPVARSQ